MRLLRARWGPRALNPSRIVSRTILAACALAILPIPSQAAEPFELRDGDRVVFVGSTLTERDQTYGYLETLLTSLYPDRNVTYRNLGWSGDNVFGAARARFGPVAEGYQHLQQHVEALKPTVAFVAYGTNESFEGQAGLPAFLDGLKTVLDMVAKTGARIVIVSPTRQEDLGRPLPDPAKHNQDLKLYVDALRSVAEKRGYPFVDLYEALPVRGAAPDAKVALTDDGLHLTAYGYWRAAQAFARELGLPAPTCKVTLDATGSGAKAEGTDLSQFERRPTGARFVVTDRVLPLSPVPVAGPGGQVGPPALHLEGLPPGRYLLKIDGKDTGSVEAKPDERAVAIRRTPGVEQVERLRRVIHDKNLLYFHRWRPQNETYLYGFRKHEQGQNAREVPLFDPLVEKLEKEIASLRKPVPHTYELIREGEVGR